MLFLSFPYAMSYSLQELYPQIQIEFILFLWIYFKVSSLPYNSKYSLYGLIREPHRTINKMNNNIIGEVLVIYLRVNSDIIIKEMARTISRLLNSIVLKLDGILNKVLKTYRLLIVLQFIDIARVYFIIGYYLRLRRVIIIFILYKEGKADYLFLGSYRPTALENTLNKILKRVIVDRMADIAKIYTLLL